MIQSLYLMRSGIRRDLLGLFFGNPRERYYLRELQRKLGYSAGSIRRELLKFVDDDLLCTQAVGNLVYYSLNTEHPLYEELQSIVRKTLQAGGASKRRRKLVSKDARRQIVNYLTGEGAVEVAIFGSYARGEAGPQSDLDILVEFKTAKSLLELAGIEQELAERLGVKIDLVTEKALSSRLARRIKDEIEVLEG